MAKELADALGIENFSAINGWLDRFRIRNNITFRSLCGEAADVDPSLCEDWQERLPLLLAGYDDEDIFNMDEKELFLRALPNNRMIQKSEEARSGKIPKERLTISFCVSAAGEKEKPLVIWRCQGPRCFKGKDLNHLGVSWYANKKAWMTSSIFEEWLVNFVKKMRNQARKVILVLDNATRHTHGDQVKNVKLLFLPPNTTSKHQPLDHGVIKCFKMEYRQCALRHVIVWMDAKVLVNFQRKFPCGISSREVERQLDLFDESTAEDQLEEFSKLAGKEYDPESFQYEVAVECFDDYCADWEERLLVNESAEGSNSVSDEEFSDTVCNRQQAKLSTQATLGEIDELIGNSDAMTNESVRNLLFKLKNELERIVVPEKSKNLKQSEIVSFFQKM
ncbi:Tigger transposable element-derived protein 6 [Araneus ventricosus]|uniref:Tigger transposable element-derived protein 6 n=1 Tax=Araneus ventricosus TaxID=182803 RepID=A0A4Y2I4M2_ARAVE|nr:Tigger transposable element-derived protein 6 [Araneus ventricosus]